MPRYLWLRIGIVLAVIVGSLVLIAPRDWRGHPRQPINLGLDLQGGIHLVLGVDLEKGIENVLDRMAGDLRQALQKKGIGAQVTRQGRAGVTIQLSSPQATQEAQQALASFVEFDTRSTDPAAGRIELTLKEKVITERRNSFIDQGLKVIRNRVDQFGVAEPTIQKQGDNRILVQLPGVQDPARAKALIGKTAVLEFKLLDDQVDAARAVQEGPPPGDEILYGRRVDRNTKAETRVPYVVKKEIMLTGDVISDATVRVSDVGEPYVSVLFDSVGARLFGEATEKNVGKALAIVLDGNVHSAPVIRERIREEFRLGKTVRSAIDAGFQRAFTTVIDTHVTVVVSGIILYQFGTGPVKGFAVTLMIGIVASLFTAVFFTRLIFDLVYKGRRRLQTLSI